MRIPKLNMTYVIIVYGVGFVFDIIFNFSYNRPPLFSILAFVTLLGWEYIIGDEETTEKPRITLYDIDERLKKLEEAHK